MKASLATAPAQEEQQNEDFAGLIPGAAVLLDGSGLSGTNTLCRHGVAWYVKKLGVNILRCVDQPGMSLAEVLEAGIRETADAHKDTCNLQDPGTPSSTVIMIRARGGRIEYLVLADSVLVVDQNNGSVVVQTDDRESRIGKRYRATMDSLKNGTPEHDEARREYVLKMRDHRNKPNGFWVAAADPRVAREAMVGSFPVADVRSTALLSDGASRLVDRFHLITWRELVQTLEDQGPSELIRQVRSAEKLDAEGRRWPRGKTSDDATALYIRWDS